MKMKADCSFHDADIVAAGKPSDVALFFDFNKNIEKNEVDKSNVMMI